MSNELKLKGNAPRRTGPYPLGEIPHKTVAEIGKRIIHRIAVGHADIEGNDFSKIFADSVGGTKSLKPVGIADVSWKDCCWSVKTIKAKRPFKEKKVRLISGRNAPSFSQGIVDWKSDIQGTGDRVLSIWNARLDEAMKDHDEVRIFVMIRNMDLLEFTIAEFEAIRFVPANYFWEFGLGKKKGKSGNLHGYDCATNEHRFTWQHTGGQFTIKQTIPHSVYRFKIDRHIQVIAEHKVLMTIGFDESWIIPVNENGLVIQTPTPVACV
jgi:hypothetical protein